MRKIIGTLFCSFLLVLCFQKAALAQAVFYHISNEPVYEFLEELASLKAIQLNSAMLPLTRRQIYDLLQEAESDSVRLNRRQMQDLRFYQQDFIKDGPDYQGLDFIGRGLKRGDVFPLRKRAKRYDLFHYKDKLFNITLNSRFGGEGWLTKGNFYYERVVGATVFGNVSRYFSFYADLTDYHATDQLTNEHFLNQRMGANYKGTEFSEMRGGVAASVKWGYLALVKDHVKWGTAYNGSNIFSGRTPSFPMVKLHLDPVPWFSFDYIHAWLISDVIDSAASYQSGSTSREIMRPKFMAANMFTVRPVKGLYISLGNSVVYSDQFNPVYLIPFLFYKSVDHTLNSTGLGTNSRGQNSQMFMNIVSRQVRYLELYTSLFIDEIRMSTMFNPKRSRNHLSWKAGLRFTAPKNINASLVFEYTRTNPFAYEHFISTTTFESNSYGLGHYLRDNAEEFYAAIIYKPVSRLTVKTGFTFVRKGETYPYTIGSDGQGYGFITSERLVRYQADAIVNYQVAQDVSVKLTYQYLKETGPDAYKFMPAVRASGPHSLSFGLMIGI